MDQCRESTLLKEESPNNHRRYVFHQVLPGCNQDFGPTPCAVARLGWNEDTHLRVKLRFSRKQHHCAYRLERQDAMLFASHRIHDLAEEKTSSLPDKGASTEFSVSFYVQWSRPSVESWLEAVSLVVERKSILVWIPFSSYIHTVTSEYK
ncbi:hypothetical protein BD410DRAFT_643124 [Rickenella mellea]|uniref:Uncharacterized protein n=1 Tax=Rickenella mellea TaxID=50990 RepID=A0A4Y7PLL7_9AGAM|nr:hypothetical protein BD410DRAFT_155520 [Rickenella mellea]TDL16287.1 hypothetical protein BD410DRAFT_643124 [Rickenella mellea]